MNEEVLDLYDDNFDKLDQTVIRRVDDIPDGTNIMAAYVIIKNNDKYLLERMTERNNFKWAIPGGHVLSGESDIEALKRELYEEIGINNINFKHIEKVKYLDHKYIFSIYESNDLINLDELVLQVQEVSSVEWFSKEEIIKMIEEDKIPKGYAFMLSRHI